MTHALRLSLSIYITKEANQASKDFRSTCNMYVHKSCVCCCGGRNDSTARCTCTYIYSLVELCEWWIRAQQKPKKPHTQYSMLLLLRIVCLTVCIVCICLLLHSFFISVHSFIHCYWFQLSWTTLYHFIYSITRVCVRFFQRFYSIIVHTHSHTFKWMVTLWVFAPCEFHYNSTFSLPHHRLGQAYALLFCWKV